MDNAKEQRTANTGLAKVAVQCSADTFVVNQSLVLRINICGENRHIRQALKRYTFVWTEPLLFGQQTIKIKLGLVFSCICNL